MPFGFPDTFVVKPLEAAAKSAWGTDWNAPTPVAPTWADDEGLKKRFGAEVAKSHPSPFAAASAVFPEDTSGALWVSINWINDPIVLAARDLYLKTVQLDTPLLDKNQLASKLLLTTEEKVNGRFVLAADDRLSTLKLYAQLMGYLDTKNNASGNSFTQINQINVKLVKTEKKDQEHAKDNKQPVIEPVDNPLPVKLKLVSR